MSEPNSKLPDVFLTADGWQIAVPQEGDDVYASFNAEGVAPSAVTMVNLTFTHKHSGGTTETKNGVDNTVSIDWGANVGIMQISSPRETGSLGAAGGGGGAGVGKLSVVMDPGGGLEASLRLASAGLLDLLSGVAGATMRFVTGPFDPATDTRVTCVLTPKLSPLYPIKVFNGLPLGNIWIAFFADPVGKPPPYLLRVVRTDIKSDVTHRSSQTIP